jgi:hypothetical protein
MTIDRANAPRKPLRLWPGVVAAALQWLVWLVVPAIFPQWGGDAIIGGLLLGLIIVVWWLFFSRARWPERLGAIVLMIAAVAVTARLVHESIADGMMGFMPFIYAIPAVTLALVVWAVAARGYRWRIARFVELAPLLDIGAASASGEDIRDGPVHTSMGAGVRLRSDDRVFVRVDWATRGGRHRFVLSLSPSF